MICNFLNIINLKSESVVSNLIERKFKEDIVAAEKIKSIPKIKSLNIELFNDNAINIMIVSHGGILKCFLKFLFEAFNYNYCDSVLVLENTSLTILELTSSSISKQSDLKTNFDVKLELPIFNDICHYDLISELHTNF